MRIITGKARGANLYTLAGNTTRPTSDRVKEAVFSMLQFEIEGRSVLDLFGGSGQLALEALSRGARDAVIADSERAAVEIIKKNAEKTKLSADCTIMLSDWKETLRRSSGKKFDIVFLDPPYSSGLIPEVLKSLYQHLKPTSIVVCESDQDISDRIDCRYEIKKTVKYGVAHVMLLKIKETEE